MLEKNLDLEKFELSRFVVGNIVKKREGLKPKQKGTTVGYMLPQEDLGITLVYDFFSNRAFELNDHTLEEGTIAFDIVNRPWIESEKKVSGKELNEILEIMEKYKEDYLEVQEEYKLDRQRKSKKSKVKTLGVCALVK